MGGQGRRMEEEPHATVTASPVTIAGGPTPTKTGETYKEAVMHGKKRFPARFPRGHGACPRPRSAAPPRAARAAARSCLARKATTLRRMLAPAFPDAASLEGDVAVSGAAFWSLLAGVLALAVAAQYAVIVAGGARGAAHYAHDAWLAARSSASHYVHDARDTAASVMHGAPHWAWASADTSHPAEALRRARSGVLRARAWPWNWLRADTRYYDAPHGAGDTLFNRIFYRKRPACAPPLKYGNWASVAASHVRYGACETGMWTRAHLMPWTMR